MSSVLMALRSIGYNDTESEFILSEYINDPDSTPNIGLNPKEIAEIMAKKVMGDLQE